MYYNYSGKKGNKKGTEMKKFLIILLTTAFFLTSCDRIRIVKIGIIQYENTVEQNNTYKGIIDGLRKEGYIDKENVDIEYVKADKDFDFCVAKIQEFISDNCGVIVTIGEEPSIAATNLTSRIPIIFACVDDPVNAHIVENVEKTLTNATGSSDFPPCESLVKIIKQVLPKAKRIACLYDSKNNFSNKQVKTLKQICEEEKITCIDAGIIEEEDLETKINELKGTVSAIYLPNDNFIADNMTIISATADRHKIPLFCNNKDMLPLGALVSVTTDYYEIGKKTASSIVAVLFRAESPSEIPVIYSQEGEFDYSPISSEKLGIEIPDELKD